MNTEPQYGLRNKLGLILAPIILILFLCTSPPEGLSIAAWRTAAVALIMATLWISEAIALPATSLFPLVLFPLLGVSDIQHAASPYAHKIIFLMLGGFLLALSMQKWGLHKRYALHVLKLVGTSPNRIIAGSMIATGFLSMWVSNTATTLMMLPIAMSIIYLLEDSFKKQEEMSSKDIANFSLCLTLAIAYSANVGGVGTIIGTPVNGIMVAFLADNYDYNISFVQWMTFGIPFSIIMLVIIYLVLTRFLFNFSIKNKIKGADELINNELAKLGKMSRGEGMTSIIGGLMAFLWIFSRHLTEYLAFPKMSSTVVAMLGGILFFIVPINLRKGIFVLKWEDTSKLPWGIMILMGGGLSLSSAIKSTGLADYIGGGASALSELPMFALVLLTALAIIFLTEINSNTATISTFLPILGAIAITFGINPLILVIPATVAASCAFMLPVATPPNAVAFGSGRITLPQMAKAGLSLNLITFVVITILLFTVGNTVFDLGL